MRLTRDIDRYNRLLLRDLGEHPRYEWKWSEDLLHVMDAVDALGKPEMTTAAVGSLYVVTQAKRLRKICPHIVNRWCICALVEINGEDGLIHGTGVAGWMPCHDKRSQPVALPEGQRPNQYATEDFIKQMRRIRERDAEEMAQWAYWNEDNTVPLDEEDRNSPLASRKDAAEFKRNLMAVKNVWTAFGEVPGKKGSTIFGVPQPESQAQE